MVPRQWLAALDVIWHIYLHLHCKMGDGGRDLPSSGEESPTMGQVPCEFWADWPNFIFQPVALDVIWYIYSGQCCFKEVEGIDPPSSGDVALTMGQVPLWVLSRLAKLHFSASSSWCELAHLIRPALLQGGFSYGPAVFRRCCPHHGAGPMWVLRRLTHLHFSASGSWHDLAYLLWAVLLQGGWRYGPAILRGCCPHHWAGHLGVLRRLANLRVWQRSHQAWR